MYVCVRARECITSDIFADEKYGVSVYLAFRPLKGPQQCIDNTVSSSGFAVPTCVFVRGISVTYTTRDITKRRNDGSGTVETSLRLYIKSTTVYTEQLENKYYIYNTR